MSKNIKDIFDQIFAEKLPNEVLRKSNYQAFQKIVGSSEIDEVIPPKSQLRLLFGKEGEPFSKHIGTHPDFINEENLPKQQYICSVFLDISGSTKLGLKFPLQIVRLYKNAILSSAIEIFQVFDGHIHRLQGDAVFAYFGHQNMTKSEAIINAINAATLMQSYNKHTLSEFFESSDLPPLKIRIGIDIGDDSQVLWSSFGVGGVQEITTTSIHTDLAAKLQNKASKNSILLGENIYNYLDLPDEFLKLKTFTENNIEIEDKYIIKDSNLSAYYQMKVLDWEKYIQTFSFLPKEKGNLSYQSPKDFEIICQYSESEDSEIKDYKGNTNALEKELDLKFELKLKNRLKLIKPSKITWEVQNRGQEAEEAGDINYEMDVYQNKHICHQRTAYNGHHYMNCKLYDERNNLIGKEKFGLFINDEKVELKKWGINTTEGVMIDE